MNEKADQGLASEQMLQATLVADQDGSRTREMLALLGRSQQAVRTRLRGNRSPAEFKAAEQMALALDASERVIRQVWESTHGRSLH